MKRFIILSVLFCITIQAAVTPDNRPRPTSYPYISGDTFREFADFVIDEGSLTIDPQLVKTGNVIFFSINNPQFHDYLEFYFNEIHSKINVRYILVTHNTDCTSPGKSARFLDDEKLIAWFTVNTDKFYHPKLFPLPIGLVHKLASSGCGATEVYDQITQDFTKLCVCKDKLLYMNFSISTNKAERWPLFELFAKKDFCGAGQMKPAGEYIQELAQYKFVLCPAGAGLDCHRTWEALLVGTIPVLKKSTLDRLFDGLPVVLVNNWEEVTQEFLEKKYQELLPVLLTYDRKKIYAEYWLNQIRMQQKGVLWRA